MGRSVLVSALAAITCAVIVWVLGRLLDSTTLTAVAVWAGALAGVGNFVSTRMSGTGR